MTDYQELFDRDFRENQKDKMLGSREVRARRYQNVFNLVRGLKFGEALDIGCADGEFTGRLGKVAYAVAGIDVSPAAIEQAREALPDFDFRVGDATDLPFSDSSFNLVSCLDVLYYLDEAGRKKAADEIYRVLRPQGFFLVATSWPFRTKTRTGMSYMRMREVEELLGSRFSFLDRGPTSKRFEIFWTGAAMLFRRD
jgi:ubiquinone/menaquinone biosynthesis C-methylase UbiE